LSLIYNDFNFERIPHRRPFTVCSRYIRTRILIGFGGISADIGAKSRFPGSTHD
jgi:hypothetical protein